MKVELYVVPVRGGRFTLFSTHETLADVEAQATNRVRQSIEWFVRRPNRVVAWAGRSIRTLHDYYLRLEDRIDPVERVLKAMASATSFLVNTRVPAQFQRILRRQRWKHVFWFSIDFVITGIVIVFTPFLAPIPGPNLFFYYPFLRLLSHYRSILGASSGLRSSDVEFKDLPELSRLEDNLPGLARFLDRME
jgi:hypothetical protein